MRVTLLLLMAGWGVSVFSQGGFYAVKDENVVRQKFAEVPRRIHSVKSAFVQEKHLSALENKTVSKGFFYYLKENKVRLEFTTPFPSVVIINDGKMQMQDGNKAGKSNLRSTKAFQSISRIMTDFIHGTALSNPDFSTKILENTTQYKLEMSPENKMMKNYFSVIYLFFDKKDQNPTRLELHEKSGDYTSLSFTNRETNIPLDEALFSVKP